MACEKTAHVPSDDERVTRILEYGALQRSSNRRLTEPTWEDLEILLGDIMAVAADGDR